MQNKNYTHIAIRKQNKFLIDQIDKISKENKIQKSILVESLLETGLCELKKANLIGNLFEIAKED